MSVQFTYWLDQKEYQPLQSVFNVFTPEECERIIAIGDNKDYTTGLTPAVVTTDNHTLGVRNSVRRSEISWVTSSVEDNRWIYDKINAAVVEANKYYGFDLEAIENVQFTRYNATGEFYGKHIDTVYSGTRTRKLSITIQLCNPTSYVGGDLALYVGREVEFAPREQGTANFFPSYALHEVMPVTQGVRYSLVAWMNGPRFK